MGTSEPARLVSMALRKLRVDMEEILDAVDSHGDAPRAFLNVETGEIELYFDSLYYDVEESFDPMDGPWEEIPRVEAREEYRAMEEFADGLDESDVQTELGIALAGKGAFHRFRMALSRHPDLQSRWEESKRQRHLNLARQWLGELGIEPAYGLRRLPAESARPTGPSRSSAKRPGLMDLLLLGAPDGKTELLDGRVHRVFLARSPGEARKVFAAIARELTEMEGIGWRRRFIEDRDDYEVGRCQLRVEDSVVEIGVAVPREIWDAFSS